MIVDRLVIHHTYDGNSAVDVSQNHNHGRLEGVSLGGGSAHFDGGSDCVRVRTSPTLSTLRAVRTTVRFRVAPNYLGIDPGYSGITGRRLNLIEGYLSFALVVDDDRALHGTILDRSGHWKGARSVPGVVSVGAWHEATFVHDGFSACRVDLDGVPVAEALDVIGPVSPPRDPYGVAIGHWPDPGNQYSFVGDIDDVKVWIDRPEAIKETVDPCCMDGEAVDDAFQRVRDGAFDPAAYQAAAQAMMDIGSRTFGAIAAGTPGDRTHAWDLARRFVMALQSGDRDAMVGTLADATDIAMARIPPAQQQADAAALVAALRPTLMGPLTDALARGSSDAEQHAIAAKLGIDSWLSAFCHGWANQPDPRGDPKGDRPGRPGGHDRPPKGPPRHSQPDRSTDPGTDRDPDQPPPSWGADGAHRDEPGDQS